MVVSGAGVLALSRMVKYQGGVMALGVVAIVAGLIGLVKGQLKWTPEKILVGAQARLASLGMIGFGALMLGGAAFWPNPIWSYFSESD